jgi:type IV pilus assembly protein PilA
MKKMKKTLQKGFSLVELLVVAIIGVLAGVGIVGYQSYTESAKQRVAIANFNSVKRFVETELTLLNNNIQTTSGAVKINTTTGAANCTSNTTFFNNTLPAHTMGIFMKGVMCYFAGTGYANHFENPFLTGSGDDRNQVLFLNQTTIGTTASDQSAVPKGSITIDILAAAGTRSGLTITDGSNDSDGNATVDHTQATTDTSGWFILEYATEIATFGSSGDTSAKLFNLK